LTHLEIKGRKNKISIAIKIMETKRMDYYFSKLSSTERKQYQKVITAIKNNETNVKFSNIKYIWMKEALIQISQDAMHMQYMGNVPLTLLQ
jgi:competence transcription factor ComK